MVVALKRCLRFDGQIGGIVSKRAQGIKKGIKKKRRQTLNEILKP